MILYPLNKIDKNAFVSDIVLQDYRTAAVFRKHGIGFCCGTKFPLEVACSIGKLELESVCEDLENATRTINVPNILKFDTWNLCFLADYVERVHHEYLRVAMPESLSGLEKFAETHQKRYSYLSELVSVFGALVNEMLPHMVQEEEIIFPYIRRVVHAFNSKESYAGLLVRTLRKPVKLVMNHEHALVVKSLYRIRELTNNYSPPSNSCANHKVIFYTLREVDNDLVQHLHLENNILFPRAIEMEKELLQEN